DMDAIFTGSVTNRQALIDAVNTTPTDDWTPLAETLYEAMLYFKGAPAYFNSGTYTSPIQASCQKNYIIIITDGMSTQDKDGVLTTICSSGDCDGDGFEPDNDTPAKDYKNSGSDYLDDVAWYLNNTDLIDDSIMTGKQNVIVHTIGFGVDGAETGAVKLLDETAFNGKGNAYIANNTAGLTNALTEIVSGLLEDNTSFVAPVVPVSPENRTYSSSNVFVGFFRPDASAFWGGNVKKYGLNSGGKIVDNDMLTLSTNSNGVFYDTSTSFWGTIPDGGKVEEGGVGKVLLNRDLSTRKLYTYFETNVNLTNSVNVFNKTNITPTMLGYLSTETSKRDDLIDFIYGYDPYDTGSSFKRAWVLGDILHSRPMVVNYASYVYSLTNMADCTQNKSIIYVGANDGMLHAFKDCDGSEVWGFIPPDVLGNLKKLTGTSHPYFVDGSPRTYIYDYDKDGNIEPADGDIVLLLVGERRGGSTFYVLDVTDFNTPKFLGSLSPSKVCNGTTCTTTTLYGELGQSWSDPVLGKVKEGGVNKIVFFIGGGYDETTENTLPLLSTTNTKGRAFYAFELVRTNSGKLNDVSFLGTKVFEYSYNTSVTLDTGNTIDDMTYSIPSEVTAIDSDGDDYLDTVYVGDIGAQMWRFYVGDNNASNWTGSTIFKSNPSTTEGRKIFYPPDVVQELDPYNGFAVFNLLYFGTGDRANPKIETIDGTTTGTASIDRMYMVKDRLKNFDGSATVFPLTESNLEDVTTDDLQLTSTTSSGIATILGNLSEKYGWFIQLDDTTNFPGEKILAPATVFNRVVFFTAFSPTNSSTDPCIPSAGTARIFAMNYLTGEAVFNYDLTNDGGYSSETNTRAKTDDQKIVKRSDRVITMGASIPSGVVIIVTEDGPSSLVGVGGALGGTELKPGGGVNRIFWKETP
ncbi:MAG TPA: PilC/PilY family type IV pilus protein, partial [Nitrospiria bacterium]